MKDWQSVIIAPSASIREALAVINIARSQFAMVAKDDRRLIGTLSDGDIRRALLAGAAIDSAIDPWICRTPIVVSDGTSIDDILLMMRGHGLHQIPILDAAGCIVGLRTVDDFLTLNKRTTPVVIMAGGMGTRLQELTRDTPKPMLPVGGQPMLEMILNRFVLQGFSEIWLAVNYRAEVIENHFGDGRRHRANIRYLREDKPLGTAGGLSLLPRDIGEPVVVSNADLLASVDYAALVDAHVSSGAAATMAVKEQEFAIPFGVVFEDEGRVVRIEEKPVQRVVVNAGIYVLSPEALHCIPPGVRFDMPQLFEKLIADRRPVVCHRTSGYWLDIGRHADYNQANALMARHSAHLALES